MKKNADKTANAFQEVTGLIGGVPTGYRIHTGLTKRETFVMHIAGHMMESLNQGAYLGEWDYPSFDELADQAIEFTDKIFEKLEGK